MTAETDPCASVAPVAPCRPVERLIRDRSAATAIEYSLIGALISVAIITAVSGYSNSVGSMYNTIKDTVANKIGM